MRIAYGLERCAVLALVSTQCASPSVGSGDNASASGASGGDTNRDAGADDSGGTEGRSEGGDALPPGEGVRDGAPGVIAEPPPGDASQAQCGTRSGQRGKTSRMISVNGTNRTYIAYLPPSADPKRPLPFVMVFHGFTMSGAEMYGITQYSALADSEGIAVVFPDGQPADPWNVSDNGQAICGAGAAVNNPNAVDFAFIDAFKADVEQDQCLDAAHVFATGFSMGGYFSHHVGCDRADVRAVAPHSGGTIGDLSGCKTGHVPVIIFHGVADALIVDGCDDPNGLAQPGFPPSATLWGRKNGCATTFQTTPNTGAMGGTGQCYLYDGCPADGQVELCTFNGLGHAWAGGSNAASTYADPRYASATQLEWAFWKKYAW
jgi:polyhydroxybutyrate depolymerase